MPDDTVTVPLEVRDGLKRLQDAGALQEGRRERAIERAREAGEAATARCSRR